MSDNLTPETVLRVTGIDCAECARSIERSVARLEGVQACSLSFETGRLHVYGRAAPEQVIARVQALGYDAAPEASSARAPSHPLSFVRFLFSRRNSVPAVLGAVLIAPGVLFDELLPLVGVTSLLPDWAVSAFSLAALAVAGWPVLRSAWRALRLSRQIGINALMSIAAVGAIVIGAHTEAGLVMVLFAIGEALESYTMQRAREAIRSLMELAPQEATVLRPCIDCKSHLGQDGYIGGPCPFCGLEEQRAPVSDLKVGEMLVIRPGERIAMDGRVISGASSVNQAPITGESAPVEKTVGDKVFAGSVNGAGALMVEITHLAADNTISRMIRLVEEAQEQRAPTQRLVDRFAQRYTPTVVALAALVAVVPPALFGAPFLSPDAHTQGWLYRALELLVIACPCALVISTPVALVSAIASGARNGVLFKGSAYLEALGRVRVIAFDKTGTLTAGNPSVVRVRSTRCTTHGEAPCEPCDDLLALATAVERRSEHPLARAVVIQAEQNGVSDKYRPAESVTAIAGRGVAGVVNGQHVLIGSHALFEQTVPHDVHCEEAHIAARNGQTPLLVGADGTYLGYIAVADTVRSNSRSALAELKQAGVERLVMLTGDNLAVARQIAEVAGITHVHADLLPEDKVQAVRALRQQFGAVAMVGDGINDTPALAAADVGISIGGGTAQAIETADITLMANDLSKLPFALRLSRAALRTIHVNIGLSVGAKLVFFALALAGLGTMWMAVLADVGVSLLVTLNGLRLLGFSPRTP
ncbi:MAG: cation-translocating P-type ATPase [Anaerolineae bacterium]|nr:cation-translocating P-type ATPase [Thermoflexales bacterium]MDW8406923.1 cation-translocating P-type ATPase [Anaerolineae bacterium]